MKLRFLGTGDAFGSGGRFNTCFYVFYPRQITPEDVLQAGAADAIRKSVLKEEDVLSRLAAAQDFYRGEGAHKVRADGFNANITLLQKRNRRKRGC